MALRCTTGLCKMARNLSSRIIISMPRYTYPLFRTPASRMCTGMLRNWRQPNAEPALSTGPIFFAIRPSLFSHAESPILDAPLDDEQRSESSAQEQQRRGFWSQDRYRRNLNKSLTRRVGLHQRALQDRCDLIFG